MKRIFASNKLDFVVNDIAYSNSTNHLVFSVAPNGNITRLFDILAENAQKRKFIKNHLTLYTTGRLEENVLWIKAGEHEYGCDISEDTLKKINYHFSITQFDIIAIDKSTLYVFGLKPTSTSVSSSDSISNQNRKMATKYHMELVKRIESSVGIQRFITKITKAEKKESDKNSTVRHNPIRDRDEQPRLVIKLNSSEEWRVIKDFPAYEISNFGRVRTGYISGDLNRPRNKPFVLSIQTIKHKSYVYLRSESSDTYHVRVSKLVANAFLGEKPLGKYLYFLNGNTMDNKVTNLAYLD